MRRSGSYAAPSPRALVWVRARRDFEEQLVDALMALRSGAISPRQYDIAHARIKKALVHAEHQFEKTLREDQLAELSPPRRRRSWR